MPLHAAAENAPLLTGEVPLASAASSRELARRWVVRIVFAIYVLLILEGALRKWLLPQFQQYIYFIRDPFAIMAIGLTLQNRLLPASKLVGISFLLVAALAVLACCQVVFNGYVALAAVLGVRNYCLYIVIALIVRHTFARDDLLRLVKLTLVIAMPMAVLSLVQFMSPASAFINQSYSGGEVFTVTNGIVRTTGTFTFNTGMACFIASCVSGFAIAYYQYFRERIFTFYPLTIAAAACFTCLAVSGNRTAFTHSGIILLAMIVAEIVKPADKRRMQILFGVPAVIAVAATAMFAFFGNALNALVARQANATASGEDFMSRIADILFGGFHAINSVDLMGAGIGRYSPGGASLSGGVSFDNGSEYEFTRVLIELGLVFGPLYMVFRWSLMLLMLVSALRCLRRNDDVLPLMMWTVASVLLIGAQMASQSTVNGYGWMFTGFTLAAISVSVGARTLDLLGAARQSPAPGLGIMRLRRPSRQADGGTAR